jgi:rhodanese-related sulfurtransferase
MDIPDLDPHALAARLVTDPAPLLLDVREPWEFERAHIAGSVLMPLATLPTASASLARDTDLVVICHHGVRSAMAAQWLVSQGFTRVANLDGGIDAWSCTVDSAVPRY